jgi:DNA-binding MarR family transcriptional regulator
MGTTSESNSQKQETRIIELGGSDAPLEHRAFLSLVRTASRLEGELNRLFRQHDLTNATYNILRVLEPVGTQGLSCGEISEQLIAEVPDMTRLLDRLERLGYVSRHRSEVDRRMVKVVLSQRGLTVLQELKEPVEQCHKKQMSALNPDRLQLLMSLLQQVQLASGEALENPVGLVGNA